VGLSRKTMKKSTLVIAAVVVLLALAAVIGMHHHSKPASKPQGKTTAQKFSVSHTNSACDIFTLADAKKVLGNNAVKSSNSSPDLSTQNIKASECNYTQTATPQPTASGASTLTASLGLRAATNSAGQTSLKSAFASNKHADAQTVSGYGDSAYWDPLYGQLNVLKGSNWYQLGIGAASNKPRDLTSAEQFANVIASKF
jgi:hypothetical protein